ncbi:MAG: hypothetical protein WD270_12020 [Acetobacterales bacterium]
MAFSDRASAVSGPIVLVTVAGTLLAALGDVGAARAVAVAALLLYLALEFPRVPAKGRWVAVGVVAVVALCLLAVDEPAAVLWAGLVRSSFLVSFFAVLGLLREAAETSPAVRRGGGHLLDQPPGRRYLALTFGSHLFGMVLNYGAVALVGAMIKGANAGPAAGGDAALRERRERRMMLAMFRGFAAAMAWSPLSVMPVVVLGALPMLNWLQVAPLGLTMALCFMLLGWLLDRVAGGRRTGQPPVPQSGERWTIHLRLAGLVALILGLGLTMEWLLQTRLFIAMVLVVPFVVAGWLLAQYRRQGPAGAARATAGRLAGYVRSQIPNMRTELSLLTMSGVVGTALAAAVPGEALAALLAERSLPGILMPLAALWGAVGLGVIGLPPLIAVTFLSAGMPSPGLLGVAPVVVAGAYMAAWGLSANRCPLTAPAILLSRFVGQSSWHIMKNWNGRHTVLCLIAASVVLVLADGLIAP